ncbi:class I SAM-dependent methyltransferase, partial [Nostoc sp. NIES-2111]
IIDGIPILLISDTDHTIDIAKASLNATASSTDPLYLESVGVSEEQRLAIRNLATGLTKVDPVIAYLVAATSGHGYVGLVGSMTSYPIPNIPVGPGENKRLLDLGCSWGRWTVSAARKGWQAVGIDPSLGALLASRRAFGNEGLSIHHVCADARFLPFKSNTFDQVFSYSVLQHFAEDNVSLVLDGIRSVLKCDGQSLIQMAHKGGLRARQIVRRKDYLSAGTFRVRYWALDQIQETFQRQIGPTNIEAEAFGGLGLLIEDFAYVSTPAKLLTLASETLKLMTRTVPGTIALADSVYVSSIKRSLSDIDN